MAKRKFLKYNIPTNIYGGGGEKPNFWNSGTMQDIGKGITAFNAGVQMYKGNTPSILSLNQNVHSNNLMGTIGSAVDSTGQILSAIDALTTKERKPLEQTVGLVDSNGVRRFDVGGYMNLGTTALALTGNAIQNAQIADTSNLKNQIQEYSNNANQASSFDDLNTQWANRIDLKHITARDLRNRSLFGDFANSLSSSSQGLSAGSSFGPWGAAIGGIVGGVSSVVGSIFGRNKARKEARKVNSIIDAANARNLASYQNQSSNLGRQQGFNALSNVAAFGGPISIYDDYGNSAIGYELAKEDLNIKAMNTLSKNKMTALPNSFNTELNTFAEGGGIHIKSSKRGTFTAAAKKHGKGVQEFASQVLANKEDYSPAMVKKANFAKNAAKWHHAFGGNLLTHGAEWDNGISVIGNGGTHESNPHEGVQVGMDAEGIPNLVEEGEVIFNDYVFSNRLNVPNEIKNKYKLSKKKDLTFADAAKQMQKESEERPNDPISKKGLTSSMERLQQAQEIVRQQKNQENSKGIQYSRGGGLGKFNWEKGIFEDPEYTIQVPYRDQFDLVQDPQTILQQKENEKLLPISIVKEDSDNNNRDNSTLLRYAPVVGSAIGLANNLFTKPDYSNADTILSAANKAGNYLPVSYTPIGDYISYTPFDRNYYTNKLNALAGSTTRAIMNSTNPSRYAALLAADYNNQIKLGELERQAEEYNLANRIKTAEFNRGTNQFNSENFLKVAMANQDAAMRAKASKLQGIESAMNMRNMIDTQRAASLSSNLTNLFDSLGDIGRENYTKNTILSNPAIYYGMDDNGNIYYKKGYYNLNKNAQKEVDDDIAKRYRNLPSKDSNTGAFGGYLTIKNKRR